MYQVMVMSSDREVLAKLFNFINAINDCEADPALSVTDVHELED